MSFQEKLQQCETEEAEVQILKDPLPTSEEFCAAICDGGIPQPLKKQKWGPVQVQRASSRIDRSKNIMEKAMERKQITNLEKAKIGKGEKVTVEENETLQKPFTEEEIKIAVFGSYSDGAPGPDGMSFMFCQKFWDIVKPDLINMFNAWLHDKLDIFRLNFAMITLIPKENDARSMSKFRPISLLNCSFKIFTKVLTNRLATVIDRLISYHQSAFIRGRFILESVVRAHEVIHEVHKSEGLALDSELPEELAKTVQGAGAGKDGTISGLATCQAEGAAAVAGELDSSWLTFDGLEASYGHVSLHPEEGRSIRVVA